MQTVNHILSNEGILTTFQIAKRISKKDMLRQFKNKLQEGCKSKPSDQKLRKLLAKKIMEETKKAFINQTIPGLIVPGQNIPDQEKRKMMELTYFASVVAKKIGEKQLSKFHACYIINAIVNMLGLDEKAFEDFHKKFSKLKDNDDENNDGLENFK